MALRMAAATHPHRAGAEGWSNAPQLRERGPCKLRVKVHRWPRRSGGPGWLVDFTGVASCEGGTGHAPGGRTRNHCAPFLAIFHLYTPENPSTPRLTLYSYSLHPLRARQDGRAMHRIGAEGANSGCTACTAHPLRYLFIIVPKVRPPLILVPPMLPNRGCGRGAK
jgi:hypothetical protein